MTKTKTTVVPRKQLATRAAHPPPTTTTTTTTTVVQGIQKNSKVTTPEKKIDAQKIIGILEKKVYVLKMRERMNKMLRQKFCDRIMEAEILFMEGIKYPSHSHILKGLEELFLVRKDLRVQKHVKKKKKKKRKKKRKRTKKKKTKNKKSLFGTELLFTRSSDMYNKNTPTPSL